MSLVVMDTGKINLLTALLPHLNGVCLLHLYVNSHVPAHGDALAAYTEASFPGYAPVALTGWTTPYLSADFHAWADETTRTFTRSSSGTAQTVYGYFVTDGSTTLLWAEALGTPITVTASGDVVSLQPRLSLTSEF